MADLGTVGCCSLYVRVVVHYYVVYQLNHCSIQRMSGAIPLLPLFTFVAWTGALVPL